MNEIIDKILSFWTEDKWCKGALAKDINNKTTYTRHPDACKWCLLGIIRLMCPEDEREKLRRCIRPHVENECIGNFNDNPNTKFEDVIALLRKVKQSLD